MTKMPPQLLVWTCLGASLGTMGFFSALASCGTFAFPPLFDLMPTAGMPPAQEVLYRQFLYDSVKWAPLGVIVGIFKLPLAIGLMLGGGKSLMGQPGGDTWLQRAYRYGIGFEPIGLIIGVSIGFLTVYAMDIGAFLGGMGGTGPGAPPPEFNQGMTIVMWAAMAAQCAIAGAWTLGKMGFYWWGIRVLETDESKAFYDELTG